MRKTIVMAAVAACMFVSNVFAQRIKGSDTCLPLSQTEAENFINKNKSAKITVTGGGSGVGISALMEGTTDIAMSSRKMKFDEKVKLQEAKKSTKEVVIAYDALAVVVHPSNKVSNLTREQLEGIFTGKIKNWKEVGGADMKIVAYSRETSSGTYEFFKESVLKNKNYMNGILSMPATGAIIQSVSQTKGAIGYVGLAYAVVIIAHGLQILGHAVAGRVLEHGGGKAAHRLEELTRRLDVRLPYVQREDSHPARLGRVGVRGVLAHGGKLAALNFGRKLHSSLSFIHRYKVYYTPIRACAQAVTQAF